LPNLKVKSRTSAFRYKGKEQDAEKVGKELNVRAVLTGSLRQIGDQIEISVSLDDALDNHQIWGSQYARKASDLLSIQREIAREITGNLRLKLSSTDERRLRKHYTENAEAYQFYLKGLFYWNKRTGDAAKKISRVFPAGHCERSKLCAGICRPGRRLPSTLTFFRCSTRRGFSEGQGICPACAGA